jgi:hypothetical protein
MAYFQAVRSRWSRQAWKSSFCPRRQEDAPSGFECGAGGFERRAGAAPAFAGIGARVEAAAPFPLIDTDASPPADGADANVAIENAPAVLAVAVGVAGEHGHRQ